MRPYLKKFQKSKIIKRLIVFILIFIWGFSGLLSIPFLNFPPKIDQARAAIAVQNDATANLCGNQSTCAVTLDVPATADMVVVTVAVRNTETISSITDSDGDIYNLAYSQGNTPTVAVYFATTTTANATKTITANLSAATADTFIDAYTLTGIENVTNPISATATNTGNGAVFNANITTNKNNSIIVFVAAEDNNGAHTPYGANQIERGTASQGGQEKLSASNSTEITTSSGNNNQTLTSSKGGVWRAIAVEIEEVSSLTFIVSSDNFPNLTPGAIVFATTTLDVDSTDGWYITLSRDDTNTTLDLTTDASINIIDQTTWDPPAVTTTSGNAVRIASLDNNGDVLAFRVMTASGSIPFRASAWWGSQDTYGDNANTLWAGVSSTNTKIGESSVNTGGGSVLNTVLYYVDVDLTQITGAYDGNLTFTATAL